MDHKSVSLSLTSSEARRNKVLFINAVNEVTRERAQSFLTDEHIQRIVNAYNAFENDNGFCSVATNDEIRAKGCNMSIPLYVQSNNHGMVREDNAEYGQPSLQDTIEDWQKSSVSLRKSMKELFEMLKT